MHLQKTIYKHLNMFADDTTNLVLWIRGSIIMRDHEFYDRWETTDIKLLLQ